jgi:hypothetical protein
MILRFSGNGIESQVVLKVGEASFRDLGTTAVTGGWSCVTRESKLRLCAKGNLLFSTKYIAAC